MQKRVKEIYEKTCKKTHMERTDVAYFRKRITQLEMLVISKTLRYNFLKKKYRSLMYNYRKVLKMLGIRWDTLEKYFSSVPELQVSKLSAEELVQLALGDTNE